MAMLVELRIPLSPAEKVLIVFAFHVVIQLLREDLLVPDYAIEKNLLVIFFCILLISIRHEVYRQKLNKANSLG
jgi:hypothetical protein